MDSSLSKSHLHRNYWSGETGQVTGKAEISRTPEADFIVE